MTLSSFLDYLCNQAQNMICELFYVQQSKDLVNNWINKLMKLFHDHCFLEFTFSKSKTGSKKYPLLRHSEPTTFQIGNYPLCSLLIAIVRRPTYSRYEEAKLTGLCNAEPANFASAYCISFKNPKQNIFIFCYFLCFTLYFYLKYILCSQ